MKQCALIFPAMLVSFWLQAQSKYEKHQIRNFQCAKVEAEATVTKSGAEGYIRIENTCDQRRYFQGFKASVEALKVDVNEKTGKEYRNWYDETIALNYAFLSPGSSISESVKKKDDNIVNAIGGTKGYIVELRNLQLVAGVQRELSFERPNQNCFKLNPGGLTNVFELDGITYSFNMRKVKWSNNGSVWEYECELSAYNKNSVKVKLDGELKYKLWFCGLPWTYEANFRRISDRNKEFKTFTSPAVFDFEPTAYIEFTYVPPVEGKGTGNQLARIKNGGSSAIASSAAADAIWDQIDKESSQPTQAAPSYTSTVVETKKNTSATISIRPDVGVKIVLNGVVQGICNAGQLFPVTVERTGPLTQHFLEIIPLASETHKKEEVLILQPESKIIKQYTFRDKIGALEDKRLEAEKNKLKGVGEKIQGHYFLTGMKMIGFEYSETRKLLSELSLNADGTFIWKNDPTYSVSVDVDMDGNSSAPKWVGDVVDDAGKWEVIAADMIRITAQDWNATYWIEEADGTHLTLSVEIAKARRKKLFYTFSTEVGIQLDKDRIANEKAAVDHAERKRRVSDSLQMMQFVVGIWNVRYKTGEQWGEATHREELSFKADGTCRERSAFAKRFLKSNTWQYDFDKTWRVFDYNTIMVDGEKYELVDKKYLVKWRSDTELQGSIRYEKQ